MIEISSNTIGIILLASWSVAFSIGAVRLVHRWRLRKSNDGLSAQQVADSQWIQ